MGTTAIVTAGAGARGAYEAGILSVLVPRLLETGEEERIVLLGTSAGALNTALLAAYSDPDQAVHNMLQVWESTAISDIFAGLRSTAFRDVASYLGELVGRGRLSSLLNTAALRRTAEEKVDWVQLRDNLDGGKCWVHGVGIVATSSNSGRTIVFLQGKDIAHPPPDDFHSIDYLPVSLASSHVLASAAIPVAFPPIRVDPPPTIHDQWFFDGGVRLNAPIKPALALGADRVIVVATTPDPDSPRSARATPAEPDLFDAAGAVLRALLEDRMAEDVRELRKTNRFVDAAATVGTPPPAHRGAAQPYRHVDNLFLGPPTVGIISTKAHEVFKQRYSGWRKRFSDMGILGTLLGGTSPKIHGEILSFVFFDPDFHHALIRLGKEHAEQALQTGPGLPWYP